VENHSIMTGDCLRLTVSQYVIHLVALCRHIWWICRAVTEVTDILLFQCESAS